ncbi:MAG: hypothetical protein KTR25_10290 [Myxococcales bacterium]|nr:hypothetical protein [Myxococcales bacterium]
MKRPDHEKSLLGHVPPGTLASSSERFTKAWIDSYTHGHINRLLRGTRFLKHIRSQPSEHQQLRSTAEVKDV